MSSYPLWTRNFLGLFISQFLGAFNDNIFRISLLSLWALSQETLPMAFEILTMLAAGLFMLPFALLAKLSGVLCDHFNRAHLVQAIKLLECGLMLLAGVVMLVDDASTSVYFMLVLIFLMGAQSALFGPVKYAILPKMLAVDGNLLRANALIEGSTFIAILSGMLAGAALVEIGMRSLMPFIFVTIALLGFISALFISPQPFVPTGLASNQQGRFWPYFRDFFRQPNRLVLILSISWFWTLGSVLLAQLPVIATRTSEEAGIITFFLSLLIFGIVTGNGIVYALASRLAAKNLLSLGILAYLVMGLLLWDFVYLIEGLAQKNFASLDAFVQTGIGVHFILVLFLLSCAAGIYSVPLYTALLKSSTEGERGKTFAINNLCNALMMVAGSVLMIALLSLGDLGQAFMVLFVIHLVLLPTVVLARDGDVQSLILRLLFRLFYRARVEGMANYPVNAHGLLIVSNHVSSVDALLLLAFLPRKPIFAIEEEITQRWWLRMGLSACQVYPVGRQPSLVMKSLAKHLEDGEHVVIFPEGMISRTGRLGKIYPEMGMLAFWTKKPVLGCRISGLELSIFSGMETSPGKIFGRARLSFLAPQNLSVPEKLRGSARKKFLLDEATLMMREVMFQASPYRQHLYAQLLATARDFGLGRQVIHDTLNAPMTYRKLLMGSQILARQFCPLASSGGGVGVLLPNSQASVTTFFALQAVDRVPVMLNFTAGVKNMISAIHTSMIRTIVTSRRFLELAGLEEVVEELGTHAEIVYLEDIRANIGFFDKILALLKVQCGAMTSPKASADHTAVILFTSGSEGEPKGVALSHSNLLANVYQALAAIDFSAADRVFNCLPMFHSFGLTVGTLLPALSGAASFQFPSPLRYGQIVELIYRWKATIFFSTNVFLKNYGELANAQDLRSLRYVCAGAEKLSEEVARVWLNKFGLKILEGYGVTETSPVLSVNTFAFHRAGTVGIPFPGLECRFEPLEDFPDPQSGLLHVRGPNVMQGYIYPDAPGHIHPPQQGWHNTGDIVHIDDECFIRILGRQRRFAKIAGEMVSLEAVERAVSQCWPEYAHAVLARSHEKRGEELVLFSECSEIERNELAKIFNKKGLSPLLLPGKICVIEHIPLLGTGKVDYNSLKKML